MHRIKATITLTIPMTAATRAAGAIFVMFLGFSFLMQ